MERNHHAMRNRQDTLLWMKDLIEHMSQCQEQLHWAGDRRTESFLTETLIGDLTECRRLCDDLRSSRVPSRALHPV